MQLISDLRHEYVDGEVYAMVGASETHNLLAGNIFARLRSAVRGGPCRVFISDMKLHVQTWKAYYYPDILVSCDPSDSQSHFKERPSLVVEVLSPGAESTDRRGKMLVYRPCPACGNIYWSPRTNGKSNSIAVMSKTNGDWLWLIRMNRYSWRALM